MDSIAKKSGNGEPPQLQIWLMNGWFSKFDSNIRGEIEMKNDFLAIQGKVTLNKN